MNTAETPHATGSPFDNGYDKHTRTGQWGTARSWWHPNATGWSDRPWKGGCVVVIGHGQWGVGKTVEEAKKSFRTSYPPGRLSDGYDILTFDADTEFHGVDAKGRYMFAGNPPAIVTAAPRKTSNDR